MVIIESVFYGDNAIRVWTLGYLFLDAKWGFKGLDRWAMISAWFGRWLLLKRILWGRESRKKCFVKT